MSLDEAFQNFEQGQLATTSIHSILVACTKYFAALENDDPLNIWRNSPEGIDDSSFVSLGIFPWEMELLLRTAFSAGPMIGNNDALDWNCIANILNELRSVSDNSWPEEYAEHLFAELFRVAHRQFPWQIKLNGRYVSRYATIYAHENLAAIVQEELGVPYRTVLRFAFSLYGHFISENRILHWPVDTTGINVEPEQANSLLDKFSVTVEECVAHQIETAMLDVNFSYRRSAFFERPLLKLVSLNGNVSYSCPIPRLLLERMTGGLYYDIKSNPAFGDHWGKAVQSHLTDLFTVNLPDAITVQEEQEYFIGRNRWDTLDILLEDASADVFIECKSRRVSRPAKEDLTDPDAFYREFDKLIADVAKSYRNLANGLTGHYPHWTPSEKPVYLVLAFLTDWFLFGRILNLDVTEYTLQKVRQKLESQNISSDIVDQIPLITASFDECDLLVSVLQENTLNEVFSLKSNDQNRNLMLRVFLRANYNDEISNNIQNIAEMADFLELVEIHEEVPD